jgi:uncharacterized protein
MTCYQTKFLAGSIYQSEASRIILFGIITPANAPMKALAAHPPWRISMRQEVLTWQDVDKLIDELLPQMRGSFDSMLMITRGGLVPGGIIAEALDIRHVLTAAVRFPDMEEKMLAWPTFLQFPEDELLRGRRVLIVDDIWGSARTINTVRGRVEAAGAYPHVAVLHYKPAESLFKTKKPEYFAAVTENYIVYPWETHRKSVDTRMIEPMQG